LSKLKNPGDVRLSWDKALDLIKNFGDIPKIIIRYSDREESEEQKL